MKKLIEIKMFRLNWYLRSFLWFILAGSLLMGLGGASIVGPNGPTPGKILRIDPVGSAFLKELEHLGFLRHAPQQEIESLLNYHRATGKTLAQILREPEWAARLGFASTRFKATWYAANPFDLLPAELQKAIRARSTPFQNRKDINRWLAAQKAPDAWYRAIKVALVETTPINLWRAGRGLRPYAKNGQFLEPIVIEKNKGIYEVRHGHIATDPRIVPTNTEVILLVRVDGAERVLRVKASDVGQAIRGRHVDLPIYIKPGSQVAVRQIRFPKEYVRNPTVQILQPISSVNPNRKASKGSL